MSSAGIGSQLQQFGSFACRAPGLRAIFVTTFVAPTSYWPRCIRGHRRNGVWVKSHIRTLGLQSQRWMTWGDGGTVAQVRAVDVVWTKLWLIYRWIGSVIPSRPRRNDRTKRSLFSVVLDCLETVIDRMCRIITHHGQLTHPLMLRNVVDCTVLGFSIVCEWSEVEKIVFINDHPGSIALTTM